MFNSPLPNRPRANAPPPPNPYNQQQQHQQQALANIRLPEVHEVGTILIRGVGAFAKRNKYITGWYVLGIIVLLYISQHGGRQLTPIEEQKYNRIMNTIDLEVEYNAVDRYWQTKNMYEQTKGWFFSCDSLCQRNKKLFEQAKRNLEMIRTEGNARMSDAKAVAGITSEIAITEMKDSFFQYFNSGKRFAKNQSMWDLMFIGIRSMSRGRDENMIEFVFKIIIQVLINFSMGLLMSLVFFVLGLWNIIRSYQPNPIMAVLGFCFASAAATSFVVTYLLAIYGATAGSIYGLAKVAETSARAQIADQRRRQYIR